MAGDFHGDQRGDRKARNGTADFLGPTSVINCIAQVKSNKLSAKDLVLFIFSLVLE